MTDDLGEYQNLAMLRVSGELLRDGLFRDSPPGQWFRTAAGVPPDAEFVRMWVDEVYNDLRLVYRHPSFPKVRPGQVVRAIDPPMHSCIHLANVLDDIEDGRFTVAAVREMFGLPARKERAVYPTGFLHAPSEKAGGGYIFASAADREEFIAGLEKASLGRVLTMPSAVAVADDGGFVIPDHLAPAVKAMFSRSQVEAMCPEARDVLFGTGENLPQGVIVASAEEVEDASTPLAAAVRAKSDETLGDAIDWHAANPAASPFVTLAPRDAGGPSNYNYAAAVGDFWRAKEAAEHGDASDDDADTPTIVGGD